APRQRALADAWRAVTGKTLSARNRAALEALTRRTDGSRRLDLPGGAALREYGELRLGRPVVATARDTVARLERGSSVTWHGWRISLDMRTRDTALSGRVDATSAGRLSVRARRAGDRLGRSRKLQDLFVDAKVPARLRDTWPIVALDDAVLWVPGLSPAPTSGPIAISAERVGDGPTAGEDFPVKSAHEGQVASKAEARRQGGKRGRP
ncbi:MAG TPA: tRNA lysidine(34) synthetase TilS, partial [Candidatus Limnocylindria bacterium]|nr:tRNA lysidine(34) synthetase TilS [Candidatus Limnocylindria bacterium]